MHTSAGTRYILLEEVIEIHQVYRGNQMFATHDGVWWDNDNQMGNRRIIWGALGHKGGTIGLRGGYT